MSDIPRMVSVPEAAGLTGVSKGQIRLLCKSGSVAHITLGTRNNRLLVNLDSLIEFLQNAGRND